MQCSSAVSVTSFLRAVPPLDEAQDHTFVLHLVTLMFTVPEVSGRRTCEASLGNLGSLDAVEGFRDPDNLKLPKTWSSFVQHPIWLCGKLGG